MFKPTFMRKSLLLILSFSLISFAKAQTYDTTTWYGKMNYIFNNISHTQITTGLLRDYGIDFANPGIYDGKTLTDTNWVTLPDWRQLYASLYSEQINVPATMLYLDTINNLISKYASTDLPVTFACLYYNYNVLDSNAVSKNLMYIQNGQIYDVANRTQSPYLLHSAFAIASTQQQVFTGTNDLVLHPELFLSNTGKTISNLQMDPGTGTYQTVSFNTPVTVNYDTAGFYAIRFKITYTDNTVCYSHTKLFAISNNNGLTFNRENREQFKGYYGPPFIEKPFIYGTHSSYTPHDFTASSPYLGVKATGDYTIDLSINNTTGQIRKPLIIISGFDPDAVDTDDFAGLTYINDYLTRINSDWNHGFTSIPLNSSTGLDNTDSFDIVYLHWHNGTDYIERNAYLLETLIQIVDSIKASNGSIEKNVIIGTSMGGLVARWALRDMEQHSIDHDTRLFICDDAPNWGANVPPAYQALVQYIAPWKVVGSASFNFPLLRLYYKDMFPDAVDGVNIFNSPAAKQMLIQRYILSGQSLTADNSVHTSFMNEINNMGWPLNCKNIILSNGACNGSTIFNDNSEMLDITGDTASNWSYFGDLWRSLTMSIGGALNASQILTPGVPIRNTSLLIQFPLSLITTSRNLNFDFQAWAAPTSGTSLIFKGDVSMKRQLLWLLNTTSYIMKCHVNSVSGMLPLDNAPGSKYDLSLFGVNIDSVNSQLHAQLGSWINATLHQQQFCFVPTVSSIPVSNPQQNLRTSLCDSIACLLPAAIADYFAPQENEIHVSYTNDNSNWILQRQAPNFNCSLICASNLSISGDDNVCATSNNYTIPNLPAGATVAWSDAPAYATINSPDAIQTTLTKVSNGLTTLTATITNTCNATPVTLTKQIYVGTPIISGTYNSPTNSEEPLVPIPHWNLTQFNAACIAFVTNIAVPSGATATWTGSVDPGVTWSQSGKDVFCNFTAVGQIATLSVSITNSCGTSSASYRFKCTTANSCGITPMIAVGSGISLSPNPANNTLQVSLNGTTGKAEKRNISQIDIFDKLGNRILRYKYGQNQMTANLDISTLNPDVYMIKVFDGQTWATDKFIKQ